MATKSSLAITMAAKAISEGGGASVLPLDVTENGTYTAPQGVAFSPVVVDVEGIVPTGTLDIGENGTYDVTQYADVDVQVETSSPEGTLIISENGTYGVSDYAEVDVQVETSAPEGILSISENGTYDVNDYAEVDVMVDDGPAILSQSGTLADPFDSIDPSVVDGAPVKRIAYDATAIGFGTGTLYGISHGNGTIVFSTARPDGSGGIDAVAVSYTNGSLDTAVAYYGGSVIDMAQYASLITTDLTVLILGNGD